MLDTRRPLRVTEAFHARLTVELGAVGFIAQKKAFVRKRGKTSHRVEMSSSHHNTEGSVAAWLGLVFTDADIARVHPGYRAGGLLGSAAFCAEPPQNIADPSHADALVALLREKLAFFDLMDDSNALLAQACVRYVPVIISPALLVPYLVTRLGKDAASIYASALLSGRPELWPAFLGAQAFVQVRTKARRRTLLQGKPPAKDGVSPDHGTELARALATHGVESSPSPPSDAVVSTDLRASNLRCFFGRQLRAWGEAEHAPALAHVADAKILALRAAQEKLTTPLVDDPESVKLVLRELTGAPRNPRRSAPTPRLFQYHVLHAPWSP